MRVTHSVCFRAFTPCGCYPVLIHTDAIVPYALMYSLCLAFWDRQSQQFEGGNNFHGNSWCMWIGPSAATICFIFGHTDHWDCNYLNLSFDRISSFSCATVLLPKKDPFLCYQLVSNLFSLLPTMNLFLLCSVLNFYSC